MLSKFENPEAHLSPDDPKMKLMSAWADVVAAYRSNSETINRLLTQIYLNTLDSYLSGPDFRIQNNNDLMKILGITNKQVSR